ncbi:Serine/threonine-protein kinase 36 [Collichthys lucidus]|uniref:non-specific serine/threonine protein kinase n=1 Tax=Collichthys lucidus TaxID=240159 RepID=A0A4U5V870_COLLU|nr:Serine/threonine-protein kinase 36 [Collichthys lucidus]
MSPELVEEKPYDHTADLWSLGCILYELHTGAPPFYTPNSIFHLVQLIVRDQSFLKGLLTKDPQKRLSWPDLLHHPFVADGVPVLSDSTVFSPLTVTPSPDMLALKLQQVAAKTVPTSGQSRLLRKAREHGQSEASGQRPGEEKQGRQQQLPRARPSSADGTPGPSVLDLKNQDCNRSKHSFPQEVTEEQSRKFMDGAVMQPGESGSRSDQQDYEQEFPSVEVGPRLLRRHGEDGQVSVSQKNRDQVKTRQCLAHDVGGDEYWENLSDPNRPGESLDLSVVVPQIKSQIAAFRVQLTAGVVNETWKIQQPLKVLQNLLLTHDPDTSNQIGQELGLPHVLFELVHDAVENSAFIQQPGSVPTLGEMISVLIIYWQEHGDWTEEHRLDEFTKPFVTILGQTQLAALAPLAATVLSLFTQHVDVEVDLEILTSLLKKLLMDSYEPQVSLPPGFGLCDGVLSLLLHKLSEQESSSASLDPDVFLDLWKRIGASLEKTTPDLCSAHASAPARPEVDLSHDGVSVLSCHLLCFPFALELPSRNTSTIFQSYDSCGIVEGLVQVIQTLPSPLLARAASLLAEPFAPVRPRPIAFPLVKVAYGFFTLPGNGRLTSRTAGSLLADFLQQDVLWDSAAELLTLLSQVACCSPQHSRLQVHVDALALQQALAHPHDPIRAAACRLLGSLNPLRPPVLQPDVFRSAMDCLHDSSTPVRRMACRAVGNWMGYMAVGRSNEGSHSEAAGDLSTIAEQGLDEEDGRGWAQEARRTAAMLAPLISDADALTRRHCCTALGNLVNVDGAAALLSQEDVFGKLLRAACSDSHNAVRQAAITTLSLYSRQDAARQVLISLDAEHKLVEASHHAAPHCDYDQLIGRLRASPHHFLSSTP